MTKKLIFLFSLVSISLLWSCSSDEANPVVADFSLAVTGESPNATVTITNSTTGASVYTWAFSEGAGTSTSLEQTPAALKVDKAGTFEVTLVATGAGGVKTVTKSIEIPGESALITYTDIAFGREAGSATYARFFSTETGLSYKDSELNATNGPKIDLAYAHISTSVNYFASPDDSSEKFGISGATTTLVLNYPSESGVTTQIFDAATDDSFIKDIAITSSDNQSFGTSNPYIVLFKNKAGKKGAIKTTAINADRLLVTIKVQKYL